MNRPVMTIIEYNCLHSYSKRDELGDRDIATDALRPKYIFVGLLSF